MSLLFEIGASVFDCILCVYFITKFNKAPLKNVFALPALLLICAIQLVSDHFLNTFSLLNTVVLFIITLIYALLICRKHYFRAIVSACIYKIVLMILSTSLFFVFNLIFKDLNSLLYGEGGVARYIYVMMHKVLLFSILQLILKFFRKNDRGTLVSTLLTFLFSIVTIIGLGVAISMAQLAKTPTENAQLLTICLIFLVLNCLLYILILQISKLQSRNYELKILGEKADFEEKKYKEALSVWNSAEKIRHDVKNHMIVISEMLEDQKLDECKGYVGDIVSHVGQGQRFTRSGNMVIDYLIDSKLSSLDGTEIIVAGAVGRLSDIKDTDLASLIGNILDNAVEAQEKLTDRRIELLFAERNRNRIIICKNNISGSVLKSNSSLKTTKKAGDRHGYGHQIVDDIVRKYNGLINYFEENGMFGVEIILPGSEENSFK